jgi:LmbE family N-acetylglucosaminyl deacetylase
MDSIEAMFARPLFIGAHADDIELFAGGTVARFADVARMLVFSMHGGQRASNRDEIVEAASRLGINPERVRSYDFPACQVAPASFVDFREKFAEIMRSFPETTVAITHQSGDSNQDHKLIHEEVMRVFYRDTPILCGHFPQNDSPGTDRRFFVKLSKANADAKIAALAAYRTQRAPHRSYFEESVLLAAMRYHGSLIGADYAEPFEVMRLWI